MDRLFGAAEMVLFELFGTVIFQLLGKLKVESNTGDLRYKMKGGANVRVSENDYRR